MFYSQQSLRALTGSPVLVVVGLRDMAIKDF